MTTERLWETLRTRWWWLALGLMVGLVGGAIALAVLPETYRSEAAVLVDAQPAGDGDGSVSATEYVEARLPTYVDLGASDAAQDRIREELGEDLSRAEIEARVTYVPTEGSMVLAVEGAGGDPESAQAAAAAGSAALSAEIEGTSTDAVEVSTSEIQAATAPTAAESPVPSVVLPAGAILGLLVPFLAALVNGPRPSAARRKGRHQ